MSDQISTYADKKGFKRGPRKSSASPSCGLDANADTQVIVVGANADMQVVVGANADTQEVEGAEEEVPRSDDPLVDLDPVVDCDEDEDEEDDADEHADTHTCLLISPHFCYFSEHTYPIFACSF
jgi:U3 small nucleolar RNA-associated protein 14